MIALEIEFLAGRFHATPWGRAVNEGDVEWPPAPWRLLRAIVAGWMRSGDTEFERLTRICDALAEPPRFLLPPATLGHSRHYMKKGTPTQGLTLETSLVIDAFAATSRQEPSAIAYVIWDSADIAGDDRRALLRALENITYLGRAESWCEIRIAAEISAAEDQIPVLLNADASGQGPVVRRLAPMQHLRGVALLKALLLTTSEMRASLRTQPNGTDFVDYRFPPQFGMDAQDLAARNRASDQMPSRIERFVLEGRSYDLRPSVTQCVRVAEAMRGAAMRRSSDRESRAADPILSGKAADGSPAAGHKHAFYLPRDIDGDGKIDHIDVWLPSGSSSDTHRALVGVREIYGHEFEQRYAVTHIGRAAKELSRLWSSSTPYVPERHVKMAARRSNLIKSDSYVDQIMRSLRNHGLPTSAEVAIADHVQLVGAPGGRKVRADAYQRTRQRERGPSRPALSVRLAFPSAVEGPIAIGGLAHFGLGQFSPVEIL